MRPAAPWGPLPGAPRRVRGALWLGTKELTSITGRNYYEVWIRADNLRLMSYD